MDLMKKLFKRIYMYGEMVMFSHTLFSLPFALLTIFIAANGLPNKTVMIYGLIALIGARTGANAFNRYADRQIDQANPRTADRHIPAGKLKSAEALALTIVSYLVYFFAAYHINLLCFDLAIVPLILFTVYPYTKRFTYLCHLVLGVSAALAVLGAWMAVRAELFFIGYDSLTRRLFITPVNWIPIILFIAVMLWNAGFDTIYGTQDIEFDRSHHLFSLPARFGLKKSLLIAKIFHFFMILLLLSLVFFYRRLSYLYIIGIIISSVLFLFEHKIVKPHNPVIMKLASYKLNQIISLTIFTFACIDIFFV